MKNLFDPLLAEETKERILRLQPASAAQWGKMTVTAVLAHCTASIEMAMGEKAVKPAPLTGRLLGRVIKPLVLRDDAPMRRNSPSAPDLFAVEPERLEFDAERARLLRAVDEFVHRAPAETARHLHPFFGPLSSRQWAVLMYKHVDHHLRQFGA